MAIVLESSHNSSNSLTWQTIGLHKANWNWTWAVWAGCSPQHTITVIQKFERKNRVQ